MTYPNALRGVRSIFTGQILSLLSVVCLVLGIAAGIATGASLEAQSSVGMASFGILTVILFLASAVLPIIGYILYLIGLRKASKDEDTFGTAFGIAIFV